MLFQQLSKIIKLQGTSKSQNCRGWKRLQEFIESNRPAKAAFLQQVTQAGIQMGLQHLHTEHSTTSRGRLFPCCIILTVTFFLVLGWNFYFILNKH